MTLYTEEEMRRRDRFNHRMNILVLVIMASPVAVFPLMLIKYLLQG